MRSSSGGARRRDLPSLPICLSTRSKERVDRSLAVGDKKPDRVGTSRPGHHETLAAGASRRSVNGCSYTAAPGPASLRESAGAAAGPGQSQQLPRAHRTTRTPGR